MSQLPNPEILRRVETFKVDELKKVLIALGENRNGYKADLRLRVLHLCQAEHPQRAAALAAVSEVYEAKTGWQGLNGHRPPPAAAAPRPAHQAQGDGGRGGVEDIFRNLLGDYAGPSTSAQAPAAHSRSHHLSQAFFTGNDSLRRVVNSTMGGPRTAANPQARAAGTAVAGTPSLMGRQAAANGAPAGSVVPGPRPTDAKMIRLPFYDSLAVVIPPTALLPKTGQEMQDHMAVLDLHKSPAAHRFVAELNRHNDQLPLPRTELQLRFFKYDPVTPQKEEFPAKAIVRIDKSVISLPPAIPTNKPGAEAKRPSRPVDITAFCYGHFADPRSSARLTVTWQHGPTRPYFFYTVEVVRRLSATILVTRLRQKGARPPAVMKAMVAEKLKADSDPDLAVDSLRVSLLCPLGMMRIKLPGKTRECKHPACFDLSTFLAMNEKKPTWTCPCCAKPAHFDDLVIEGLFEEILRDPRTAGAPEVELYKDGNYRAISEDERDGKTKPPSKAAEAAPTRPSTTPSKNGKAAPPQPRPAPVAQANGNVSSAGAGEEEEEIICLDSDGEEEAPARSPAKAQAPPVSSAPTATSAPAPAPASARQANSSRDSGAGASGSGSTETLPAEDSDDGDIIVLDDSPEPSPSAPPSLRPDYRASPPSTSAAHGMESSGLGPPMAKRAALSSTSSASPRPGSNATPTSSGPPTPAGLLPQVSAAAMMTAALGGYQTYAQQISAAYPFTNPAQAYVSAAYAASGLPLGPQRAAPPQPQPPALQQQQAPGGGPAGDERWQDPAVDAEFQRFLTMCQSANPGL